MITYWLWDGNSVVTAIRLPEGTDHNTVRSEARMSHLRNPTIYADFPDVCPYEQEHRISRSDVRVYPGER